MERKPIKKRHQRRITARLAMTPEELAEWKKNRTREAGGGFGGGLKKPEEQKNNAS